MHQTCRRYSRPGDAFGHSQHEEPVKIHYALPLAVAIGVEFGALKGAKPAELPVQAPAKYELAINLKTAKALGIQFHPRYLLVLTRLIE